MIKSMQKSICLVTGCAGNVGSNLVRSLLENGFRVVGVDNYFSGIVANMADFYGHPDFEFYERSILDVTFLENLFCELPRLSAVFHLAAIISVPYSLEHPEETMEVNYKSSMILHELAKKYGCKAFMFAGSAAEYGNPVFRPVKEEEAGNPLSPYGLSKFMVSTAIEQSCYGCSLRFFNIYGPTRAKPGPYDGVVRAFLQRTQQGVPPVIHGDGSQTRDFVYLGDAVMALLLGAGFGSTEALSGIYNVGTGKGTSIRELAMTAMLLAHMAGTPECGPARQGDVYNSVADNSKLRKATGWLPRTTLQWGLASTVAFMEKVAVEQKDQLRVAHVV